MCFICLDAVGSLIFARRLALTATAQCHMTVNAPAADAFDEEEKEQTVAQVDFDRLMLENGIVRRQPWRGVYLLRAADASRCFTTGIQRVRFHELCIN